MSTSATHNAIMKAGGKDRAPMLVAGSLEETKLETYSTIDENTKTRIDAEAVVGSSAERRCGGAFVRNVGNKKYNKYKESTLCKGMLEGLKMKNEDDEDKDEIKGLIWVNNHISNKKGKTVIRSKGKEIARASSPPLEYETEIVNDAANTLRHKEIDRLMTLISTSFKRIYKPTNNNLRTSSNTRNKNVESTPKTVQDSNEEPTDQELEAHYVYMSKIQEVIPVSDKGTRPIFDEEPLEQCDSNTTPDSSDMCNNGGVADPDEQKFQEERALLASLIEQMKREIDENKKINNSLESLNKSFQEANAPFAKKTSDV
ncbi:hypothetical protein Tco_0940657 [Tanacetum coccineum]|uniref:Uncharacterized protein n=1 Tax=Tanacetum coccineum TaxID=301880 RepID=A0ABQ5DPC5_9ASTR